MPLLIQWVFFLFLFCCYYPILHFQWNLFYGFFFNLVLDLYSLFFLVDSVHGVSECIIVGRPVPVGTGLFRILKKRNQQEIHTK
jgi:hypothetical protein